MDMNQYMEQRKRKYTLDLAGTSEVCYCAKCDDNTRHSYYLRQSKQRSAPSIEKKCLSCKKREYKKNHKKYREYGIKFRATEYGASYVRANNEKAKRRNLDRMILNNIGRHRRIVCIKCVVCGKNDVKQWRNAASFVYGTKCKKCSQKQVCLIGVKMIYKDVKCRQCGDMYQSSRSGGLCYSCKALTSGSFNKRARAKCAYTGAMFEKLDRNLILQRDSWRCYICMKTMQPKASCFGDRASVDHVIPLSKGGSHTYDNVKACCMACNIRKHAKVREGAFNL